MSTLGGPEDLRGERKGKPMNVKPAARILGGFTIAQATWSALTTDNFWLATLGWSIALFFAVGLAIAD